MKCINHACTYSQNDLKLQKYEIHKGISIHTHMLTSLSSSVLVQSSRYWNYDAPEYIDA